MITPHPQWTTPIHQAAMRAGPDRPRRAMALALFTALIMHFGAAAAAGSRACNDACIPARGASERTHASPHRPPRRAMTARAHALLRAALGDAAEEGDLLRPAGRRCPVLGPCNLRSTQASAFGPDHSRTCFVHPRAPLAPRALAHICARRVPDRRRCARQCAATRKLSATGTARGRARVAGGTSMSSARVRPPPPLCALLTYHCRDAPRRAAV